MNRSRNNMRRGRGGRGQRKKQYHEEHASKPWWKVVNTDEPLKQPNWSQMSLEAIQKIFYQEHPLVSARDMDAVQKYRDENKISVTGSQCPKPVLTFEELNLPEKIMAALSKQNITTLTRIQSQVLPIAMSGRDMVGIDKTACGKTLAYILPALIHITGKQHPRNAGEPDVVILVQEREIANQIKLDIVSFGPDIGVTAECFYGDCKRKKLVASARRGFEICIATPWKLGDFIHTGLIKLHRCAYVVLDEADRMKGTVHLIKSIINQTRPDRQILMFGAELTDEVKKFAEECLHDYILVNIGYLKLTPNPNITQKVVVCPESEKLEQLGKIMKDIMEQEEHKTLVLCHSKTAVDYLTLKFRLRGWDACAFHGAYGTLSGGYRQQDNDKVLADFKAGQISILVATDLSARGFDVDDIKFVVGYDCFNISKDYIQRISHVGHNGKPGTVITLFTETNQDISKQLISVLEESSQVVDPQLRHYESYPAVLDNHKKNHEFRVRKKKQMKEIKQYVKKPSYVNRIPLGNATDSECFHDLGNSKIPGSVGHDKMSKYQFMKRPHSGSETEEFTDDDDDDDDDDNDSQLLGKSQKMPKIDHGQPTLPHFPPSSKRTMHGMTMHSRGTMNPGRPTQNQWYSGESWSGNNAGPEQNQGYSGTRWSGNNMESPRNHEYRGMRRPQGTRWDNTYRRTQTSNWKEYRSQFY